MLILILCASLNAVLPKRTIYQNVYIHIYIYIYTHTHTCTSVVWIWLNKILSILQVNCYNCYRRSGATRSVSAWMWNFLYQSQFLSFRKIILNYAQYYSNIPRSIMLAVPLVTAVYFMMNVAYMTVLNIPEMIAAPAVAVVTIIQYFSLICYTQKTLL